MYRTSIWISATLVTGLAFADEVPDVPRQQLLFPTQDEISSSLIYVNCEYPIDDGSTDCTIQQVFFTKPEVKEGLTDDQRKTCSPTFLAPGSRRFTWESEAKHWRSVKNAGGSCGSVNVTTLKSEDGTWWSYLTQTIISNPEAKESITGANCSEWTDASPLVWRSRGNAIRMNCQIIGNSWNK